MLEQERLTPFEKSVGKGAAAIVAAFVAMFLGSLILSRIAGSTRAKGFGALGAGATLGILLGHRYGAVGWGVGAGLGGLGMTALFAEFAGSVDAGEAFGFQQNRLRSGELSGKLTLPQGRERA